MKVIVTGSQGFIGSYLCKELLSRGHKVIGIDNYSKYGKITRPHDTHENFELLVEDVIGIENRDVSRFSDVDVIVANAAMVGGITYFHKHAYDLLATNERITASIFDLSINLYRNHSFKKIVVISSSMVYESTLNFPTAEHEILNMLPPATTYGFQKLACEYFCKGANTQYGLPYVIVRPFNIVGVGEDKEINECATTSGNVSIMMSHVLPDLISKMLMGQYPLHILGAGNQIRCYTNGKDIARGLRMIIESNDIVNNDFNISTGRTTSVLELANLIWKILGDPRPFECISDPPMTHDVQMSIPDVSKAKNLLGFESEVSLEDSIQEVITYVKNHQA